MEEILINRLLSYFKAIYPHVKVAGYDVFIMKDGYFRLLHISSEILLEYAETVNDVKNNCFEDSEWFEDDLDFDAIVARIEEALS